MNAEEINKIKEELIQFLKDNLRVEVDIEDSECCGIEPIVEVYIGKECISKYTGGYFRK